jgi:hypothetical protein
MGKIIAGPATGTQNSDPLWEEHRDDTENINWEEHWRHTLWETHEEPNVGMHTGNPFGDHV